MRNKLVNMLIPLCVVLILAGCGKNSIDEKYNRAMDDIVGQEYDAALGLLNDAMKEGANPEDIYRGMGLAYMGKEDYGRALSSFKDALEAAGMFPGDMEYDINYYMAVCYYHLGDYEQAVSVYDGIIGMKPKEEQAYFLRGEMKLYMGDVSGAIEDFDKTVSFQKNNYSKYLDVYNCMKDRGYESDAIKYLDVVMTADTSDISDYDKGRLCYYQGDFVQGCNYLERARKNSGDDKEIILLLSDCYKKTEQYEYAAVIYNTYLTSHPDPDMYNQLGLCYMQQGDYSSALGAFQSGIDIKENNTCIQSLLLNEVACYEYLLDFSSAKGKLEEYMNVYPVTEDIKREYAFLTTR